MLFIGFYFYLRKDNFFNSFYFEAKYYSFFIFIDFGTAIAIARNRQGAIFFKFISFPEHQLERKSIEGSHKFAEPHGLFGRKNGSTIQSYCCNEQFGLSSKSFGFI